MIQGARINSIDSISRAERRSGKSLVELLVSIGIIALMASIFLSAAMMVLRMAQNLGR